MYIISETLLDAKVELNPHQVEAALFAFRSPLSGGAILADEVGLGKIMRLHLTRHFYKPVIIVILQGMSESQYIDYKSN